MSHISAPSSGDTSHEPLARVKTLHSGDKWDVPSGHDRDYELYIRTPTHAQRFLVSPGDTITITPHKPDEADFTSQAEVDYGRSSSRVTMYDDDRTEVAYTDLDGKPAKIQSVIPSRNSFRIRAPSTGPQSVWLHSPCKGSSKDRLLAEMEVGEELRVRRILSDVWRRVESRRGLEEDRYIIGTLTIYDKVGYVTDHTRGGCTILTTDTSNA